MSVRVALVVSVLAALLAGCAGARDGWLASTVVVRDEAVGAETGEGWGRTVVLPVSVTADEAEPDEGRYTLDSGDRLRIFVYGQPSLSRIYVVDQGGFITVPLIGAVKARGATTFDLERAIAGKLGVQYVKDPQVTVDIAQNRPFFILGEVRAAGQYPYMSGLTIKSAVAVAGGYSERANERKVQITRRKNGLVERMDVPDDFLVRPGDTIYVYERFL